MAEYRLVDPAAGTISILLRSNGSFAVTETLGRGQTLRSPTLEGFEMNLADAFSE